MAIAQPGVRAPDRPHDRDRFASSGTTLFLCSGKSSGSGGTNLPSRPRVPAWVHTSLCRDLGGGGSRLLSANGPVLCAPILFLEALRGGVPLQARRHSSGAGRGGAVLQFLLVRRRRRHLGRLPGRSRAGTAYRSPPPGEGRRLAGFPVLGYGASSGRPYPPSAPRRSRAFPPASFRPSIPAPREGRPSGALVEHLSRASGLSCLPTPVPDSF